MTSLLRLSISVVLCFLIMTQVACKPSKSESLQQLALCLEAQDQAAKIYNKRNTYLDVFVKEARVDKYGNSLDNVHKIKEESKSIADFQKFWLDKLNSTKNRFKDKELINRTIDFLIAGQNLEEELNHFMVLWQDSIIDNEEESAIKINEVARELKARESILNTTKSEFFERYNVSQKEVDSILEVIRAD